MENNREQETQNEFIQFYEAFREYKQSNESIPTLFNVDNFVQGMRLNNNNNNVNGSYPINLKYTKEQIRRFMKQPDQFERQLREVSEYFYVVSQEYKNLINYYGNMLTHDFIAIPDNSDTMENFKLKKYRELLDFLESYNIKSKLSSVEKILLREDVYFGYERTDGEHYVWQQLPSNFCKIVGLDGFETYTFAFDFSYFTKANINVNDFPEEFQEGYRKYQASNNFRWQKLDPDKAICFKLDKSVLYNLPMFSGLFDDLLALEVYKDDNEESTKANNYKILHQKIPMKSDKDAKMNQFLIDDKYARKFHDNVKANVPNQIGVVTTPMEVEAITLSKSQVEEDVVMKAERNLFTSAGVSQLIFNSDKGGSIGLNRSIENDSSIMYALLRQYELFFKKRLRRFSGTKTNRWKLSFPDITVFNKDDMFEKLLKSAQFGYSKFFVSTSLSLSQHDMLGLMDLENKYCKLVEEMKPLQSSHVQNGEEEQGRKEKKESKLTESGMKTKDTQANKNKAK